MKKHIVVLGAGFGGLELSSILSEELGSEIDITLIDRNDAFFFGFSKFDVMFGSKTAEDVRIKYHNIMKPGVRFLQETITSINPDTRRVTTNKGTYDADVLVVALGADYDISHTPGLAEFGNEFYSFSGAQRLREVLPAFSGGRVIVGVTSTPFKCPPAPSEAVLLLHDYLTKRGIRADCEISLVMPFGIPIPPSPETSKALIGSFAERGISFLPNRLVRSLDGTRHVAVLDNGDEMPYDLFLGIPKHCVPNVVAESGLTVDGWVPVDTKTLKTRFENVYAIGDVNSVGTPKAGVFSEGAARTVAAEIIAEIKGGQADAYRGIGACYIEFGSELVGKVEVEFLAGPPTGTFTNPSAALAEAKREFGSSRRARWFGL